MLRQTFTINTYSSSSSWFYHVNQRVPYTGRIRFDKNSSQYLSIHAMTMYYIVTDIYVWRCRVIEQFYYMISEQASRKVCKSWGIWQGASSLHDPHNGPIPAPSVSVKTQRNTVLRSFYYQSHEIIIVNCMKFYSNIFVFILIIFILYVYWYIKTVQSKWIEIRHEKNHHP